MNQELRERVEKELTSVYDEWQDGSPWSYVVEIMADAILFLFASSLVKAQREAFVAGWDWRVFNDGEPGCDNSTRAGAEATRRYPDAFTAHHEAGEWRGLWKCVTGSNEYTSKAASVRSGVCSNPHKNGDDCRLVPYERRKGGA